VGKQDGPDGKRQDIKGAIGDLDRIVWKERRAVILFDSNVRSNDDVRIARFALAKELRERRAHVFLADISPDLGVNGIDDVVGQHGAAVALRIIESAYDPKNNPKVNGDTLTEERLAQEFEFRYRGELLYDHQRGRWFVWEEELGRWVLNETRLAFHFARDFGDACPLSHFSLTARFPP